MAGITIKKLGPTDLEQFVELIRVFEDVFEMDNFILPGKSHLTELLKQEHFSVFVALSNDAVIGGLTGYTLTQYYSEQPQMYLYDLGVKMEHQRQGIGRTIIAALTAYCRENGMEVMFVQADEEDAHARDFYRSTGGREQHVVHFNYYLE